MALLNEADKVYLGSSLVSKVYAGVTQVYPPAITDADVLAIFASFTVPPTEARQRHINDVVLGLKAGTNIWSKLDVMMVEAAADGQAALQNWKAPGTFTPVPVGTPVFTVDQGYHAPTNAHAFDTTWDPATNGVNFTQNSASLHQWCRTELRQNAGAMVGMSGVGGSFINPFNLTIDSVNHGLNTSVGSNTFPPGSSLGLFSTSRNSSTSYEVYRNGVLLGTQSGVASQTPTSTDWRLLTMPSHTSPRQLSFHAWGGYLTGAEIATLFTVLHAYMLAVGAVPNDVTGPILLSTSPADNSTIAGIADNLTATFDETVVLAQSGTINLKKTSDDSLVESWDLATEKGNRAGQVEAPGTAVTVRGTTQWPASTEMYVTADPGAILDAWGNTTLDLTGSAQWSFTTVPYIGTLDLDLTNPATASQLICVRSTEGWAERLDGTWQKFDANVPRITDKGLLLELATAANLLEWNRDLANAAWTKTSTTVARDQTGIDGVANSAWSITATAANGVCTNAVTGASGQRMLHAWVKRVSGTGTVSLQLTASGNRTVINPTSTWQRFVTDPTTNVASGATGFVLGTAGDVIAVDFPAFHTGTSVSGVPPVVNASPYETYATIGAIRAADEITADISRLGLAIGPTATLFVQAVPATPITYATAQDIVIIDDNSVNNRIILRRNLTTGAATAFYMVNGISTGFNNTVLGTAWAQGVRGKTAMSCSTGSQIGTKDGGAGATAASASVLPPLNVLRIGNNSTLNTPFIGTVERVTLYTAQKTLAELQAMTT